VRAAFDHVGKKATDKALRTAAKMMGLPDEDDLAGPLGSAEIAARRTC
jgi:guanosine-3',5'-bis(diphosphate) 3'-pyrophosphohydrolase